MGRQKINTEIQKTKILIMKKQICIIISILFFLLNFSFAMEKIQNTREDESNLLIFENDIHKIELYNVFGGKLTKINFINKQTNDTNTLETNYIPKIEICTYSNEIILIYDIEVTYHCVEERYVNVVKYSFKSNKYKELLSKCIFHNQDKENKVCFELLKNPKAKNYDYNYLVTQVENKVILRIYNSNNAIISEKEYQLK